jgi:hypothetical protein
MLSDAAWKPRPARFALPRPALSVTRRKKRAVRHLSRRERLGKRDGIGFFALSIEHTN